MRGTGRGAAVLLVGGLLVGLVGCAPAAAPATTPTVRPLVERRTTSRTPVATPSPTPPFDRSRLSIGDPASLWVVVDKRRPLQPRSYAPTGLVPVDVPHTNAPVLRRAAARAVERMFSAADARHIHLAANSTYRSYTDQRRIYDGDVAKLGRVSAARLTLRPGFSEHQTGLAIDIGVTSGHCSLAQCFGSSRASRWLDANSWRYGFVLRYPDGQEAVTGIEWEPWHFRYLGTSLAAEYHRTSAVTLEQFFGLPASPDY